MVKRKEEFAKETARKAAQIKDSQKKNKGHHESSMNMIFALGASMTE